MDKADEDVLLRDPRCQVREFLVAADNVPENVPGNLVCNRLCRQSAVASPFRD